MGRWKMPALGLAALAGIQTVRMGLVFLAESGLPSCRRPGSRDIPRPQP